MLSTQYRAEACAAVMLGQGKTVWQAEIDAAVETIDFWRFGCKFAEVCNSTSKIFQIASHPIIVGNIQHPTSRKCQRNMEQSRA